MARVLIVEDEILLRSAMVRGIGKMPGITVAQAGTIKEALVEIDAQAPDMIVSDIDLPDRSGVELLGELGRRGLRVPLLFVSAYVKAYAAQIPRHADVDVREKPLRLDELRTIIENRLAGHQGGEEAPFAPADYLQLACLGHRSVVIEVESKERRGLIIVHDGTLWTAADGQGTGVDAFRRLAFIPKAVVRVRALRDEPPTRTIHGHWEQVLLDAACEYDEASRRVTAEEQPISPPLDMPIAPPRPQEMRHRPPAPTLPTGETPLSWAPPTPLAGTLPLPSQVASHAGASVSSSRYQASSSARQIPPTRPSEPVPATVSEVDMLWNDAAEEESPAASRDPQEVAFESAFEAGVEALLGRDFPAAYAAFERAASIRPNDAKVITNLERLRQLGHGPKSP
jgi:DNA-binding response OmpR family regulator